MEGALREDSVEWNNLLAEAAKFPKLKPDITTCFSLLKLFAQQVIISLFF